VNALKRSERENLTRRQGALVGRFGLPMALCASKPLPSRPKRDVPMSIQIGRHGSQGMALMLNTINGFLPAPPTNITYLLGPALDICLFTRTTFRVLEYRFWGSLSGILVTLGTLICTVFVYKFKYFLYTFIRAHSIQIKMKIQLKLTKAITMTTTK
jgi:hypothetical protein